MGVVVALGLVCTYQHCALFLFFFVHSTPRFVLSALRVFGVFENRLSALPPCFFCFLVLLPPLVPTDRIRFWTAALHPGRTSLGAGHFGVGYQGLPQLGETDLRVVRARVWFERQILCGSWWFSGLCTFYANVEITQSGSPCRPLSCPGEPCGVYLARPGPFFSFSRCRRHGPWR